MTKKTFEEKTKIVGFWTFGGVFWYLMVSFFLKSKYPIFNYEFDPAVAYDVLKDGLTLAATFLAPVAAFVLFSDWRNQHRKINNEQISKDIVSSINEVALLAQTPYYGFDTQEKVIEFRKKYFTHIIEIERKKLLINPGDPESRILIESISLFSVELMGVWRYFEQQVVFNSEISKLNGEDFRSKLILNSYQNKISEAEKERQGHLKTITKLKSDIKVLHV